MDTSWSPGVVAGVAAGSSIFLAVILTFAIVSVLRWRHQRLLARADETCERDSNGPCTSHVDVSEKPPNRTPENRRSTCRCSNAGSFQAPYTPQKARSYHRDSKIESPQVGVKIPSPDLELSPEKEGWPLPPRLTPSHKRLRSTPARSFRTSSSAVSPFTLPKPPPRTPQLVKDSGAAAETGFCPKPLFHARGPSIDQDVPKLQRDRAASTPNISRSKPSEISIPTAKSVERPRPSRSSSLWSQDPGTMPERPVPPLPIVSTPKATVSPKDGEEPGSGTVSDMFSDHSSVLGGSRTFSPTNTDNTSLTMSSPPTQESAERNVESDQSNGMRFDLLCYSLKSVPDPTPQSPADRTRFDAKYSSSATTTLSKGGAGSGFFQQVRGNKPSPKLKNESAQFQALISGNPFNTDEDSSSSDKPRPSSAKKSHKSQKSVSFSNTPTHQSKRSGNNTDVTSKADHQAPANQEPSRTLQSRKDGEPTYYHLPSAREFQFELVAPPDAQNNVKPTLKQKLSPKKQKDRHSSPESTPPSTPSRKPRHPHRERDILSWDGSPLHLPKSSPSTFRLSADMQSQASSRRSSTSISKFPDPPNLPQRHPSHTLRTAVLNSHASKASQDGVSAGGEGKQPRGPRAQPPRIRARTSSIRKSGGGSVSPTKNKGGPEKHHKHSRSKNLSASLQVAQALRRMNSEVSETDVYRNLGGEEETSSLVGEAKSDVFEGFGKGEEPGARGSRFVEDLGQRSSGSRGKTGVDAWDSMKGDSKRGD